MGICCSNPQIDEYNPLQRTLATQKYGHYTGTWPWGLRSSALRCVAIAEKEKGRPPYTPEVAQVMKRDTYWPVPNSMFVKVVL